MTRLDRWQADQWRTDFVALGTLPKELKDLIDAAPRTRSASDMRGTVSQIFRMAKEIIFDVNEEGNITLTAVVWLLEAKTFEYVLTPVFQGIFEEDEEVKPRLVWALSDEVPVVPNNEAVAPRLEAIYADLLANGFHMKSEGRLQRFAITDKLKFDPDGDFNSDRLVIQPAEVRLLQARLREEQEQNTEVKAILARLKAANAELSNLLLATSRNEHDLQRCLTKYPILLGLDYRRVLPKHKLGSDYEMDYALELMDGSIDVMEIEASTHSLYKRNGDPTVALVHAEQQVLDWLAWLDEYSPYARAKLPGVRRPCGIVVIGRRTNLSDKNKERLRWRNMMHSGRLTVLTYDDLIDRCETLQGLLLGRLNEQAAAAK